MLFDETKVMKKVEQESAWIYKVKDKWRENRLLSVSQVFTLVLPVLLVYVGKTW